jgi:hypothetical protein
MNSTVFHGLDIREQAPVGCRCLKLALCGECPFGFGMLPEGPLRLRDAVVKVGPFMVQRSGPDLRDARRWTGGKQKYNRQREIITFN